MKLINNTNATFYSLSINRTKNLAVNHSFFEIATRISKKAIFATFALTLLNLVI